MSVLPFHAYDQLWEQTAELTTVTVTCRNDYNNMYVMGGVLSNTGVLEEKKCSEQILHYEN